MHRIATTALAVSLTLSLVACSKQQAPESTPTLEAAPAAEPSEPGTAELLTIEPASLQMEATGRDKVSISLAVTETGEVVVGDEVVGSVTADGTLRDASGTVLLTMAADGRVTPMGTGPSDDAAAVVLAEDGSIEVDGLVVWSIAEDGTVGGQLIETEAKGVTATYQGSPAARRALSLVWLGSMMAGPAEPAPDAAATQPADE